MSAVGQTAVLLWRVMRNLSRQPIWIVFMLVQPMFWLLLYSQLFRRITDLHGFGTTSYVDYLTPGIAIMTAFFSGSWAGMGTIEDLDRGVVERFLTTPAHRVAIVSARIVQSGVVSTLQALLVLLVGLALGARNGGPILKRRSAGRPWACGAYRNTMRRLPQANRPAWPMPMHRFRPCADNCRTSRP